MCVYIYIYILQAITLYVELGEGGFVARPHLVYVYIYIYIILHMCVCI